MRLPLQIAFRGMEPSAAVEARVRGRAARLERYYDRITSCRVAIEAPHRHRHKGGVYRVRIDVTVPHEEIVVGREPEANQAHTDVYVAIRDAFDAMQRRLQDYARLQRGSVKEHEPAPAGEVARLFPKEGYGFIRTPDGREVYFHRNALVDGDLADLAPGTRVEFVEEQGEEGPQATTVDRRVVMSGA